MNRLILYVTCMNPFKWRVRIFNLKSVSFTFPSSLYTCSTRIRREHQYVHFASPPTLKNYNRYSSAYTFPQMPIHFLPECLPTTGGAEGGTFLIFYVCVYRRVLSRDPEVRVWKSLSLRFWEISTLGLFPGDIFAMECTCSFGGRTRKRDVCQHTNRAETIFLWFFWCWIGVEYYCLRRSRVSMYLSWLQKIFVETKWK